MSYAAIAMRKYLCVKLLKILLYFREDCVEYRPKCEFNHAFNKTDETRFSWFTFTWRNICVTVFNSDEVNIEVTLLGQLLLNNSFM